MESATELMTYTYKRDLLANALEAYFAFKTETRGWASRATIETVTSTLRKFATELTKRLGRDPLTTDLNDQLVISTIERCWPRDNATNTYSICYGRIKAFARWLLEEKYETGSLRVLINTAVKPPEETRVHFLTLDEVNKVFETVHPYAPRDAHLVRVAFLLSRRPSEMGRLRIRDYNPKPTGDCPHGTYTYTETKANRGRIVEPLRKPQREAIEAWLAEYRKLAGVEKLPGDWYLFPASSATGPALTGTKRLRRLYPTEPIRRISMAFANAYKDAGVYVRGAGGHAARRGGADYDLDLLERAGIPDATTHVQRKLGHQRVTTTLRYVRKDLAKRRSFRAFEQADAFAESQNETVTNDINESTGETGETLAKVIRMPFGRRGA